MGKIEVELRHSFELFIINYIEVKSKQFNTCTVIKNWRFITCTSVTNSYTFLTNNLPLLKPGGASYKKSKPDLILSSLLIACLWRNYDKNTQITWHNKNNNNCIYELLIEEVLIFNQYLFLNLACSLLYWSSSSFSFCCSASNFCSAIHTCCDMIKCIDITRINSVLDFQCCTLIKNMTTVNCIGE